MGFRVLKVGLVSGAVLGSAAAYKVYDYAAGAVEVKRKTQHPSTERLTRTQIFTDGSISASHLKSLITHRRVNNKAVPTIDEDKLETALRPFIRENLKLIFDSRGWNFEEMSGRIYYFISGTTIEIYVLWKNHRFSADYTDYDRLAISF